MEINAVQDKTEKGWSKSIDVFFSKPTIYDCKLFLEGNKIASQFNHDKLNAVGACGSP